MPKFTVNDTITFHRSWRGVEARDTEHAVELVMGSAFILTCDGIGNESAAVLLDTGQIVDTEEQQIEATLYQATKE